MTRKKHILFLFIFISAIIGIYWFSGNLSVFQNHTYLNLNDTVKYVGINTCKKCHENNYLTFLETGMGKSFDIATHRKSAASFDEHAIIYDKHLDFYYKPFWENDSLKVLEFRLQEKDTVHKRTETVNYIIGSGQHTNSHIQNVNGYLYQIPMTFYTQKGKWDFPPGFENGANSRFSRMIGLECMSCHNSYPDFVLGSENKFTKIPQGITCERCHGPGELHVKTIEAGHVVDVTKEIDYTIVNPKKLPVDLQFDICSRCHLQGNAVLNEGKSFFDFRPGTKLSDVMNVFMPKYKGAEDEHIMASHVERLKMSKCFKSPAPTRFTISSFLRFGTNEREASLTCITCHNPHQSVKAMRKDVFNDVCKNCHTEKICNGNIQKRLAVGDDCVSCHMPKSSSTDIPHVSNTDHFIRKPVQITRNEKEKIKEFLGLVCINNPNPTTNTIAKAYLQYFEKFQSNPVMLDSAEKYLMKESKRNPHDLVQLYYLKKDFGRIISFVKTLNPSGDVRSTLTRKSWSNQDAWTSYRIGEAFSNLGDVNNASNYFDNAVKLAPFVYEFQNKLGAVLLASGKLTEAKTIFENLIKENPNYAPAYSNLGYLELLLNNNADKAETLYNRSLALSPDYEQGLLNKIGLLMYQKKDAEAKKLLNSFLKKYPNNKQAKEIYKQSLVH